MTVYMVLGTVEVLEFANSKMLRGWRRVHRSHNIEADTIDDAIQAYKDRYTAEKYRNAHVEAVYQQVYTEV